MTNSRRTRRNGVIYKFGPVLLSAVSLSACAVMPSTGPSSRAVTRADGAPLANADIKIVDVTDDVARRVIASQHATLFSEALGDGHAAGSVIGRGDVLDIAIWEAPPAALFGSAGGQSLLSGQINIPFAGSVVAAGRTSTQIEREIVGRLAGKAHLPQVIVRVIKNASSNVTVVGDVANSARVPVTAKGERLLDVLATVGGVRQPVGKVSIQVTRGPQVASMPLGAIIRDPQQNIRMQPDDVITALYQPYSFTALGATTKNDEIAFEGAGLTLAQALGRVNGLQDARADVKGVFIFRLEDPAALDATARESAHLTPDGKVPVIYRVNLKDPSIFFVAQSFPIRDKDVVYVSTAPLADIQKFVGVISSTVFPIAALSTIGL
jgi:polysaccharide export outer membrane protein